VNDQHRHNIVTVERENRPLSDYVACESCGRTANTIEELEDRPCREGISLKEGH
jgi:hypothetical protein